jgi:hypothetical protein
MAAMARLPVDQYTFPWFDADDCPCLSGDAFVRCCNVGAKRLPYVKIPSLVPPGDATGYAHPKCYMSGTKNCSEGKSREHYISEAILARFDQLSVSGMPWQKKGEAKILPAKSLVANILCERHNNALAPIDTLGLRAFDALTWASDYAVTSKHPGRARHYLMSGEALELWLFKLAAGIHFGGIAAADGGIVRDTCDFPTDEVVNALTSGNLPADSCLWVTQNTGVVQRGQISVGPLIHVEANRMVGVLVQFGPLQFQCTVGAPPASAAQLAALQSRNRPRVIDFNGPARDARVVLSWPGQPNQVGRLGVELSPDVSAPTPVR